MGVYPPLRPFSSGEVWAMTSEEAGQLDARAIGTVGVPQPVLMENAGRAAAAVLDRLYPDGPVVGVVGAGNNGGDALVALRTLRAWGRDARALLVADRDEEDPLLHGWPLPVDTDRALGDERTSDLLRGAAVLVDGVLGTGVRGAPRERQAAAIGRINASGAPVVAIDVPSGIDGSTGDTPGAAVRAAVTVAFGAPKLGALLHPARALVGRHVVAEIGFPPVPSGAARARVATPAWARAHLPRRGTDTHKNAVGRVLVVAGSPGMAGAAILAARAAFRAGAGFVRVASAAANREVVQAAVPEALFVDAADGAAVAGAASASDALVVGPGLGTDAAAGTLLESVLAAARVPMVLDADALNLAAAGAGGGLAALAARSPTLVTPHPGEMARLLPDVDADPARTACAAAERFGCVVLLKGAPSVVASPDGALAIDTQGSSDLAVAGMGDLLAGVCGALLAQGLAPEVAGPVGLYLSGRGARLAGRGPALVPTDVLRWLPEARGEGGEAASDLGLPFVTFDADPAR